MFCLVLWTHGSYLGFLIEIAHGKESFKMSQQSCFGFISSEEKVKIIMMIDEIAKPYIAHHDVKQELE